MAGAPGNVEEPVSADIRVTPLGGGRFRLDDPAGSRIAYAAVEGSRTWVFVDGRTFVIADPDAPVRRTTEQDERAALSAPMPASVVDVRVAAGDRVESGDDSSGNFWRGFAHARECELPCAQERELQLRRDLR